MAHFDVCIIGSGSGNTIIDESFADWKVALVDSGIFGGTCLNVGCIPTKMFVLPADQAVAPAEAARLGVQLDFRGVDWPAIRDRIFGRIDPISAGGLAYRRSSSNVTVFTEQARFVDELTLEVGDQRITADRFVIAAGSRAVVPRIDGIDDITAYTSDTVMRLPELPTSMLIVGGGFIAAEFAHVFAAFGTRVSVVNRGEWLLRHEDVDISRRYTELAGKYVDLHRDATVQRFEPLPGGRVRAHVREAGGTTQLDVDAVLMATGRTPNGARLGVTATGVELDDAGYVRVDDYQRTTNPAIYALGDVSSHYQLKHVANAEARAVQHNLLHPDDLVSADHRYVPHAVFTDPQIAGVGYTEQQAKNDKLDYVSVVQDYGSVAYGWALEDTEHFVKLLADPKTKKLIGGHIIGPQAATLIQTIITALHFDIDVPTLARGQYWIHPALPEVIENALLALPLD